MRRVLIIANLFHSAPRISEIATCLPSFRWIPTIVTPPLNSVDRERFDFPNDFSERVRIMEAPYAGDIFCYWRRIFKRFKYDTDESITEQIKQRMGINSQQSLVDRLMRIYQTFFAFPDTERTWKKPALKVVHAQMAAGDYDLLMSSSPFPTSHIIAARLKATYGLPWIADFRDLWSLNHNYPFTSIRRYFEKRLEIATLKDADAITTVSDDLAEKLKTLHTAPVAVIRNGFRDELAQTGKSLLPDKFTLIYTGSIYPGKQDIEKLFSAMAGLIHKGIIDPDRFKLMIYGPKRAWLKPLVERKRLNKVVSLCGMVNRPVALEAQRRAHLLVLLDWEDPAEKGVFTTKLFEYLAAGRPILCTGGFSGSCVHALIDETKTGRWALLPEQIETVLKDYYQEYLTTGTISFKGDKKKIDQYSFSNSTKELASLFERYADE
jgi:glycosyltransferase involved in cell wall biosynthesis